MKVNAKLIRDTRLRRGWSQEQLAEASGLGYRTIQRIEAEGDASIASARTLADTLDIDLASLQIAPGTGRTELPAGETPAYIYLLLAAGSGLLCAALAIADFNDGEGWFYAMSGALFGTMVLLPLLQPGRAVLVRGAGLLLASSFSYYIAVAIAISSVTLAWDSMPRILTYSMASLAGATVVVLAARFLLPVRFSARIYRHAGGAALLGALVFTLVDLYGNDATVYLAYAGWHILVCQAIRNSRIPGHGGNSDLLDHVLMSMRQWQRVPQAINGLIRSIMRAWSLQCLGAVGKERVQ